MPDWDFFVKTCKSQSGDVETKKKKKLIINQSHYNELCTYKVLERLILNRIYPEIEKILPVKQVDFWVNHSYADLALRTLVEKGFQNNIKTNVAYINFTTAITFQKKMEWHLFTYND